MTDYYYEYGRDEKKRRSLGAIVLDCIMVILTAVAFVAMIITLLTSHYDPSTNWIFPVVGLISPAIYLFTLILALYWVIRWRLRYAVLLFLPLALGASGVSKYIKIPTKKVYGELPKRGVVNILSYNVKDFIGDDKQKSTEEMRAFIDEQRPDIVCFQEYNQARMEESEEPASIKKFYCAKTKGLATYSRYKILQSSENLVSADSKSGSAFWSDLLIGSDTVRLYNLHLHSTAITGRDDEYLSNMEFIGDTVQESYIKEMLSRFRDSSIGRASQADSIANSIEQTPHRVIVCGDFNDTPNSYTYRKVAHGLQDAFQEKGEGISHTFRGFKGLLRIDYILIEEPSEVLSYQVIDSICLSDHLPIRATIRLN